MKALLEYAQRLALGIALEASAFPKPGNVHRLRDFDDTKYEDFLVTALIAVGVLYRGLRRGRRLIRFPPRGAKVIYGDLIYDLVSSSMRVSGGGNTCLGTAILLVPLSVALGYDLAAYGEGAVAELAEHACSYLRDLSTPMDAIYMYRAVRAARPSYISAKDCTAPLPNVWAKDYRARILGQGLTLWAVLKHSSRYDTIAREVVECYPRSLTLSRYLERRLCAHGSWNRAVVEAYLYQLAREPDSLVTRKCGEGEALRASQKARELLRLCEDSWSYCLEELASFDKELGARGVNPGSTADLVAAAISIYALERPLTLLRC